MSHVYIVNLDACVSEDQLEDELRTYGVIRCIWVENHYAFIDFDNCKDAQKAIHELDGKHNWKVELSYYSRGTVVIVIVIMVATILA